LHRNRQWRWNKTVPRYSEHFHQRAVVHFASSFRVNFLLTQPFVDRTVNQSAFRGHAQRRSGKRLRKVFAVFFTQNWRSKDTEAASSQPMMERRFAGLVRGQTPNMNKMS
jgi:hypothetical protein